MDGILARHHPATAGAFQARWTVVFWAAAVLWSGLPAEARGDEPADLPPDGSFLRLSIDGGLSPFTVVVWDVTVRGGTVVVSLVKESLCRTGQRERVRLLQGDEARELLAALTGAGIWSAGDDKPVGATAGRAKDHPRSPQESRYEVWSAWGRRMTRWIVTQGTLHQVPRALRVVTGLPDLLRRYLDPLPMRDLYVPPGRIGHLTVTASEEGEMVIDGWDRVPIPAESIEVVAGEHQVVATGRSGRVRRFRVQVMAGGIQRVHVLFQEGPGGGDAPAGAERPP